MTHTNIPTKLFLNQKEVCELSCLSRSTLERLERQNPPGIPIPRRFSARSKRYPTDLIMQWLAGTWTPEQQEVSHV